MPVFEPHGEYRLERDGYIIKNDASGAINLETIEAYAREISALVEGFSGAPFAMYSLYDPDVILTSQAEMRLRQSVAERVGKGMCAAALNLSNSAHRLIIAAQIGGLYQEAGVPWQEFDSYEAAKPWLETRIAKARIPAGET